jgi:Ca2+:H+ antiporter
MNAVSWLVIFVPASIGLEVFAQERYLLIFVASSLAILPLARWMGNATEQLAAYFGEGIGGLLNATFGNAAELIIALAALRAGLYDVVKASIVGSIVGQYAASARRCNVGRRIAAPGTAL